MPRTSLPFILHPDLETMDESTVLFPAQRVKFRGCWAVVLDELCPSCGHVPGPHPPLIRIVEGGDEDLRYCLCCGYVDGEN